MFLGRLSTRFRSVFMGIFDHSSTSTFVRSHTDVKQEGLALSPCSNSSQRCFHRVEVRTLCRPVKFIHTKLSQPCLYRSCCVQSHVGKGPSPNCSHISWYAEAFRVPFTGTKGPSPAPEKQPHTIIPPPSNITFGTVQSDK